jgi:hypothetical protein
LDQAEHELSKEPHGLGIERFNKIFQEDAEDKRKYAEYNKNKS